MNKMIKDTAILMVITLISGLLLGFVYQITKEPIALQEEKARQEAFQEVLRRQKLLGLCRWRSLMNKNGQMPVSHSRR